MNLNINPTFRFFFIINGRRSNAVSEIPILKSIFGLTAEYRVTTHHGHAEELAREAVNLNFSHIVAVGGDGTIHEIINGMLSSIYYASNKPTFTFLPRGSGNDFGRTLNYKKTMDSLVERIQRNEIMNVDVGEISFKEDNSKRYFINVIDFGLGGTIAKKVNEYRRNAWSFMAYQRALISTLPLYKKHNARVSFGQTTFEGKVLSIVIANGRWFGGGLGIAPQAEVNDGQLNLIIIGNVGILQYLFYLPRILRGKRINHPDVHYLVSNSIDVNGSVLPSELDGEIAGNAPARACIAPYSVAVLI